MTWPDEDGHAPKADKTATGHWVAACDCGCIDPRDVTWFPESMYHEAVSEAWEILKLRKDGPS